MSMMPNHQPRNSNLLDRSNRQKPAYSTDAARYGYHAAAIDALDRTNKNPQTRSAHVLHLDPSAHYKAFNDTSLSHSQENNQRDLPPEDGGHICHGISGEEYVQDGREQQYVRDRVVTHNLVVRLANRWNGSPLATIVEQCSYSTTNSRGSLLSVGRLPSPQVVENASPGRISLEVPPSSDEYALRYMSEDAQQEEVLSSRTGTHEKPLYKGAGSSFPEDKAAISSVPATLDHPRIIQDQAGGIEGDGNNWTAKGFFRGVLQNVRAGSRMRSLLSSTHASVAENQLDLTERSDNSPQSQIQTCKTLQTGDDRLKAPFCASIAPSGVTKLPAPERQSKNAPQRTAELASLAHSELSGQNENLGSVGNAFYGVSASSNATHSLTEYDRIQEASRNASFCSTMSTSYSGTVVGVDLDLQNEFPHPVRRSRSPTPVGPVWFTPQMAELEGQGSTSESPGAQQVQGTEPPRLSITSSALMTLLPIAASSGIVRPKYETPKMSFFSPSGNLIQPESSSTAKSTSASKFSGSPTTTTLSRSKATPATYSAFPATCLPPPRPVLRPMVTPPTSSAPLPVNLRHHHHNYRRPEQPRVDSTEFLIVPARAVKGCDGMVQTHALPTYAQMRRFHRETKTCPRHRKRRAARRFAEDMPCEMQCCRARFTTAIIGSCTTAGKGRDFYKRNAATSYVVSMPHQGKSETMAPVGKKRIHIPHARPRCNTGFFGPLAGHVLRICFCRPYDGAGESTHDVASKAFCSTSHGNRSMHEKPNKVRSPPHTGNRRVKKEGEEEADATLPNARVIITSTGRMPNTIHSISTCKRTNNTHRQPNSSAFIANHPTRTRGHGAISGGSALKTTRVGR